MKAALLLSLLLLSGCTNVVTSDVIEAAAKDCSTRQGLSYVIAGNVSDGNNKFHYDAVCKDGATVTNTVEEK